MRWDRHLWTSLAVAAAAVAALHAVAHAEVQPIRKGFTPNPVVVTGLSSKVEIDLANTPYRCPAGNYTTKEPILTFQLAEAMTNLRLHMEDPTMRELGGFLVLPDGRYLCADSENDVRMEKWPKGAYKLFPIAMGSEFLFNVEIEEPGRSKSDAEAAAAAASVYEVTDDGLNPLFLPAVHKVRALASDLQLAGCAQGKSTIPQRNLALSPVAVLDVKQAIKQMSIHTDFSFVLKRDGSTSCQRFDGNDTSALEVGRYTVWEISDRLDSKWSANDAPRVMELDNLGRLLTFQPGFVPTDLGELAKPIHVTGKVREPQQLPTRFGRCGYAPSARDPDLYVTIKEPLDDVTFRLLYSDTPGELRLYGPIEGVGPAPVVDGEDDSDDGVDSPGVGYVPKVKTYCEHGDLQGDKDGRITFRELEGTYAVWVGGDSAKPGADFHLVMTSRKTQIDPFERFVDPPQGLPVAQRLFRRYYPFLNRADANELRATAGQDIPYKLFSEAPEQLFVYASADVDGGEGEQGPTHGEPLLLLDWGRRESTVETWEGMQFTVESKLLTSDRPSQVRFLGKPRPISTEKLRDAISLSGPEDGKALAAYWKLTDKYQTCWADYMQKHDPTWGKDVDLYRIRDGEVTNVGDEVGERANSKCGRSKVDKTEKSLKKQLDKSRDKRRAKQLKDVKIRFGLS